ncbi:MAG: NUDIX hydrolase [Candidatus Omnitrophota bacterium]|nr:NUDIX hydrolase [Candidatus Omnitrophota bacterium]
MSETKLQFSAGGVVYRKSDSAPEVVILTRGEGKIFCLPKGKIEKSETPQETALREVREETGLNGTIERELGKIKYWFYSEEDKALPLEDRKAYPVDKVRVRKTVTFFLIKYGSGDTSDHDTDAEEVRWLPIGQALKIMTYPSERQMVEMANELLAA